MDFSRSSTLVMYAVILWAAVAHAFPRTMSLERAAVVSQTSNVSHLLAHDRTRHKRLSLQYGINFSMDGNTFSYGLYYIRVSIGSPARYYYVLMDTGSSISWISCTGCTSCPKSTNIPIQLSFYNPGNSSTASLMSCSDHRCKSPKLFCDTNYNKCSYSIHYFDNSNTSGVIVSDLIHFKSSISDNSVIHSDPIFFGCSKFREEQISSVDGILGMGQRETSLISQLAREGITPNIFAHCLRQENVGGGTLVFGEIVEPGIVYTPLIQSQAHYNIELESIYVGGILVDFDPSTLVQPGNRGVIVDSGTTMAYFPDTVYKPLIGTITSAVSIFALPFLYGEQQCYNINSSARDSFPHISLKFVGNALWTLAPQDYLHHYSSDSPATWCLGIYQSQDNRGAILGDVFLKDKIVVYDLEAQRIGWVNHNCSLPMNVSRFNGRGRRRSKKSSTTFHFWLIISGVTVLSCIIIAIFVLLWRTNLNSSLTHLSSVFIGNLAPTNQKCKVLSLKEMDGVEFGLRIKEPGVVIYKWKDNTKAQWAFTKALRAPQCCGENPKDGTVE